MRRWCLYRPHVYGDAVGETLISDYDHDLSIVVDPRNYMGGAIYWFGYHHRTEIRCLKRLLTEDMTFIDVGANQGEFTLVAAKLLKKGRVLAFEPQAAMVDRLASNVALNKFNNVRVLNFGLGPSREQVPLFTSADTKQFDGWHEGLFTTFRSDTRNMPAGMAQIVPLDEALEEHRIRRADLIKIDVEGAELGVLQGARQTLRRDKPTILLELNQETFRAAGYDTGEVLELLSGYGYSVLMMDQYGSLHTATETDLTRDRTLCNVLFR